LLLWCSLLLLPSCGTEAPNINGRVGAERQGELSPIAEGQVRLRPLEPGDKGKAFEDEPVSNLCGGATTHADGSFEITTLASSSTFAEYPLLKGWRYAIEVEVPGYYIARGQFEYAGGNQFLEIKIEEKVVDVLDDGGVMEENQKKIHHGAVRRE
jgi:hypothetical protein